MQAKITVHNVDWFLDYFASTDERRHNRAFAFVLGAGASVSSGIPTGAQLVKQWLAEIHNSKATSARLELPLKEWATADTLDIKDFTFERAPEYYSDIYERRFSYDPDEGLVELEKLMEGRRPSLGYAVLAEILSTLRHRVVVTTNFDNLVTDALAINTRVNALVCGHESLARFAQVNLRRPLVAKVHRDLLLTPGNTRQDLERMSKAWAPVLEELFGYFTPVVIGYGGNDGSLMRILESMNVGRLARPIIWCYYEPDGLPSERIQKLLMSTRGVFVPVSGFDDLMMKLADRIGIDVCTLPQRIVDRAFQQANSYISDLKNFGKVGPIVLRIREE